MVSYFKQGQILCALPPCTPVTLLSHRVGPGRSLWGVAALLPKCQLNPDSHLGWRGDHPACMVGQAEDWQRRRREVCVAQEREEKGGVG